MERGQGVRKTNGRNPPPSSRSSPVPGESARPNLGAQIQIRSVAHSSRVSPTSQIQRLVPYNALHLYCRVLYAATCNGGSTLTSLRNTTPRENLSKHPTNIIRATIVVAFSGRTGIFDARPATRSLQLLTINTTRIRSTVLFRIFSVLDVSGANGRSIRPKALKHPNAQATQMSIELGTSYMQSTKGSGSISQSKTCQIFRAMSKKLTPISAPPQVRVRHHH